MHALVDAAPVTNRRFSTFYGGLQASRKWDMMKAQHEVTPYLARMRYYPAPRYQKEEHDKNPVAELRLTRHI